MAYYTYILQSELSGRYYKGSCADLEKRLKNHNAGKVRSTKAYAPWRIHYFESFETRTEAIRRELFFKSIDGYNFLKHNGIL